MNKPKIAVVLDAMRIGGIPVACINFLRAISSRCDVTLVMSSDDGEFNNKIPSDVRVVVFPTADISSTVKDLLRRKKFVKLISFVTRYLWWSKINKNWIRASIAASSSKPPLLDESFDCAIAYHGMNIWQMNRTLYQISAKKKITWIQGDHSFSENEKKYAEEVYRRFDKIFCVSECTKERFLSDFPSVADRTSVYYVHMPVDEIIEKADSEPLPDFSKNEINIVTVGRVSKEKGQDLIPAVTKKLLEGGYNVHWYIVGDGPDRTRIEELVGREGVGDHVTLVGDKPNPYPFMKACDVYVQPSYTEGFGITIFEAAILNKLIVATDVGGAHELLCDGEDLLFVQPNADDLACGIERIITDEETRERIKENLNKRDFSNKKEMEKLISII